ncbi:MAG: uroporphyrinogen-III synthase [Proteobacteria bacterium]|nr:uroporphyrinogen-III synthase [Pseudomonadota bacterium]
MTKPTKSTILNTRPKALLEITREAFVKQGFEVIDFPCIEIIKGIDTDKIQAQLTTIKAQDVLVFTSQHAVTHAFNSFIELNIAKAAVVIAVGTKTAQVLEQNYSGNIWIPQQQNSEGVIDLLKGLTQCHSIKLISAKNGRNSIQNFASKHDIYFEQINVYQRQLPNVDDNTINTIKHTDPLFILATSVTTLNNLQILTQEIWPKLIKQPVICASNRIEKTASQLGFNSVVNLNTADPDLMAERFAIYRRD